MKHTEEYLQAKWVTKNPDGYDERDVINADKYCKAYMDGYNQALRIHDDGGRSEQLVCEYCKRGNKATCCDKCVDEMNCRD